MKYFKFTQISAETGISWAIKQPVSGPSLPYTLLPGLTNTIQLSHNPMYYVGECNDEAVADESNYIFEITPEQRALELQAHVKYHIQERLQSIYQEEKEFRQSIFFKYDESALIAGNYKFEEAKLLVQDPLSSANLIRSEALIRDIDPIVLAQKIIENHENFISKDAKIAGIRGLILDRLTNFEFDLENADQSLAEFFSEEKIGEITERVIEEGEFTNKVFDIKVGKFSFNIGQRFKHLE